MLASAPATLQTTYNAIECSFMPATSHQNGAAAVSPSAVVSVIGQGTCRVFVLEATGPTWALKGTQISVGKHVEDVHFRHHVWLEAGGKEENEERIMAVGCKDGTVAFVRGDFVRSVVKTGADIEAMAALKQVNAP